MTWTRERLGTTPSARDDLGTKLRKQHVGRNVFRVVWSIFLKNGEWFRSLGSWMPFSTCNRRQLSFIGEIHSPDYNPWWSGHRTSICKSAASRVSKWVMQSIPLNLPCWVCLTLSVAKGINAMFFLFLLSLHCQGCRRLDALFGL